MIMLKSTHLAAMARFEALAAEIAAERVAYKTKMENILAALARSTARQGENEATLMELSCTIAEYRARLAEIAAMETPACASIGKRMAAVARGEKQLADAA